MADRPSPALSTSKMSGRSLGLVDQSIHLSAKLGNPCSLNLDNAKNGSVLLVQMTISSPKLSHILTIDRINHKF